MSKLLFFDSVWDDLAALPKEAQTKFVVQVQRLMRNPSHPSLRNEKLSGADRWAFSITMQYRATYVRVGDTIEIVSVGTHKEVLGR